MKSHRLVYKRTINTKGRYLIMVLQTAKGPKEYKIKDLDFTNVMCDLEDRGIDVMNMMSDGFNNGKTFTTLRVITATLIGENDLTKTGQILSEHLKNGGDMDEILDAFTEVMEKAGFGEASEKDKKNKSEA